MNLSVLIVDDEPLARARLRTLLGDCTASVVRIEGEAANATQAIEFLQRHSVDLALVDIHMPGADGLTLVQTLRTLKKSPAIVFVTAYAEHAVQAFEVEAVDYLTKPVRLERLQAALQKVQRARQPVYAVVSETSEEVLIIQDRGRAERVPLSHVLYLKAELKYITVRTVSTSYLWEGSLGELEDRYPKRFLRIHRNALIARGAVQALEKHHDEQEGDGWAVRLKGIEELLFVSRRQLTAVRELVTS